MSIENDETIVYDLEENRKKAAEALADIKRILDILMVKFMLDGGTLLGAVRDGEFPENDENDVDTTVLLEDPEQEGKLLAEIAEEVGIVGFTMYRVWRRDPKYHTTTQIAIKRDGIKVDIMFKELKGKMAWWTVYKGQEPTYKAVPAKHYKKTSEVKFHGKKYRIPYDVEKYLELRYGDWRVPVHRSKYSCFTSDKVIKKDYEAI